MPSDDKPPRNQSWADMGKMNKTECTYNFSVPETANVTEIAMNIPPKSKISVTLEANRTFTISICKRQQFEPKRRYKNGTKTDRKSIDNSTKDYWKDKDGGDQKSPGTYTKDGGSKRPKPRKDGKDYNKEQYDWGKSKDDSQYEKNPDATVATEGYGKPSKGTYSTEMGGYKSFGTKGQGDSNFGAKDYNDTTCGDRIILLSVTAIQDTSVPSGSPPSVRSSHPVVQQSASNYMTFEVGNYQFFDDLEYQFASEESAVLYKSSWMLVSLLSLIAMSVNFSN